MKINEELNLEVYEQMKSAEEALSPLHEFDIKDTPLSERSEEKRRLLEKCSDYYDSLRNFRDRFFRSYRYYRGKQWSDTIQNDAGEYVTEEEHILSKGKLPFIQNIIRQQGKSLIGLFRQNQSKPSVVTRRKDTQGIGDMLTNALQSNHYLNRMKKLDARNFEIAMLSGAAIYKQTYQYFPERNLEDIHTEIINPARIGFNSDIEDPRLNDLRLVFEIIDAPKDEVVATFANSEKEAEVIRSWYAYKSDDELIDNLGLSSENIESLDFYLTFDNTKYRVFEVWEKKGEWRIYAHDYADGTSGVTDYTKEEIEQENQRRRTLQDLHGVQVPLITYSDMYYQFWYVSYLTPFGDVLYEGESIYEHGEHPYTFMLYPLVNGEVWGMVEDVIDQQRYINRLISLMDFIMGSSAKGVLVVPEDVIPDDMNLDNIASEWSKFDGVIKIKTKKGYENHMPQQIVAKAANIGAEEMLTLQFKLIEQIFGTSGALQGHESKSGTPASLYLQQSQNSTINSRDFMEEYSDFLATRDRKTVKLIQQFYNDERYIASGGKTFSSDQSMYFDPAKAKNIDFDIQVQYGMDSPVYRQHLEEVLMEMLNNQHINIKMFLQHSSLPFAENLLSTIQTFEQQAEGGNLSPEMQQQLQQQLQGQTENMGANKQQVGRAMEIMQPQRNMQG